MNKKLQLLLITALLSLNVTVKAGPGDSLPHRYFSFGMRTSKELMAEFSNPIMPSAIISIDPHKNVRVDAQYGANRSQEDYHYIGWNSVTGNTFVTTFKPETKASNISIGIFGMHRIERTRFYAGYRMGFLKGSYEYVTSGGSGSPVLYRRNSTGKANSLVVGGEYFPVSRFSFGAEMGYHLSKITSSDTRPGELSTTQTYRYVDASVIFRFYIF